VHGAGTPAMGMPTAAVTSAGKLSGGPAGGSQQGPGNVPYTPALRGQAQTGGIPKAAKAAYVPRRRRRRAVNIGGQFSMQPQVAKPSYAAVVKNTGKEPTSVPDFFTRRVDSKRHRAATGSTPVRRAIQERQGPPATSATTGPPVHTWTAVTTSHNPPSVSAAAKPVTVSNSFAALDGLDLTTAETRTKDDPEEHGCDHATHEQNVGNLGAEDPLPPSIHAVTKAAIARRSRRKRSGRGRYRRTPRGPVTVPKANAPVLHVGVDEDGQATVTDIAQCTEEDHKPFVPRM
jgi:hypothetical protein